MLEPIRPGRDQAKQEMLGQARDLQRKFPQYLKDIKLNYNERICDGMRITFTELALEKKVESTIAILSEGHNFNYSIEADKMDLSDKYTRSLEVPNPFVKELLRSIDRALESIARSTS